MPRVMVMVVVCQTGGVAQRICMAELMTLHHQFHLFSVFFRLVYK